MAFISQARKKRGEKNPFSSTALPGHDSHMCRKEIEYKHAQSPKNLSVGLFVLGAGGLTTVPKHTLDTQTHLRTIL